MGGGRVGIIRPPLSGDIMGRCDPRKAMVVDDSKAMRMILRKTLVELGYSVCEAANGQDALAVIGNETVLPAIMLVDWNMPVMTGLELVKALRADERYTNVAL